MLSSIIFQLPKARENFIFSPSPNAQSLEKFYSHLINADIFFKVELIDEFVHPETERLSHCYRITYRSMEKTFRDEEVNEIQDFLRKELHAKLEVELRG